MPNDCPSRLLCIGPKAMDSQRKVLIIWFKV